MMVGYLLLLGVRDVGRSSYSRGVCRDYPPDYPPDYPRVLSPKLGFYWDFMCIFGPSQILVRGESGDFMVKLHMF